MLMLANVLALALIVADEPKAPEATPTTMPTPVKPRTGGDAKPEEVWHLSLRDAIRIGLDNSEVIRVFSKGVPNLGNGFDMSPPGVEAPIEPTDPSIAIAPLNYDGSTWKFKADVMAHVRSIEQQYWALAHQSVVLWSRETAVRLGTEILHRERAELEVGRCCVADVAEAEQQLENFQLNLVTATSDLITAEKQLRNILGLPPSDGRRIVPDTAPDRGEARTRLGNLRPGDDRVAARSRPSAVDGPPERVAIALRPESAPALARPGIAARDRQPRPRTRHLEGSRLPERGPSPGRLDRPGPGPRARVHRPPGRAEGSASQSRGTRPPPTRSRVHPPIARDVRANGLPGALANTRQAQYQLLRQRAALQQITHQTTHSLARFFLEVDANYKQFRTAQRLRAAAQQRLEAQRAFYEEGRITIDRLLDAVSQYTNAIATEAQYKSSYNTSIVALEEAKGTLLAYDKITVAERPSRREARRHGQGRPGRPGRPRTAALPPERTPPPRHRPPR